MSVEEQTIELGGSPVLLRRSGPGAPSPVLYLHGLPASSAGLTPFLERTGGLAPDLPGFGRSGKGGHLDYSLAGHAAFVEALLDALDVQPAAIVGHAWGGALALVLAQRAALSPQRLVLINPVPVLPDFEWPRLVQWWRRPGLGELIMGATSRRALARTLRRGASGDAAWSEAEIARLWNDFDQGTQRALLRSHRATPPALLAQASRNLAAVTAPALIIWGELDPWLPAAHAPRLAAELPNAELEVVTGAGHWPWREQRTVIERAATFLAGSR